VSPISFSSNEYKLFSKLEFSRKLKMWNFSRRMKLGNRNPLLRRPEISSNPEECLWTPPRFIDSTPSSEQLNRTQGINALWAVRLCLHWHHRHLPFASKIPSVVLGGYARIRHATLELVGGLPRCVKVKVPLSSVCYVEVRG